MVNIKMSTKSIHNGKNTFIVLALLTLWRIFQISLNDYNLSFDEAQYWHWSNFLSFGYFSKPPVVAWVIALFTSIFGEGETFVRMGSAVAHMLTAISLYFTAKELYSKRAGFYSAIVFATIPGVSFSSMLISTDPFLMCFWGWALFAFVKAMKNDEWKNWILLGVFLGFGMLSKYAMIAFLLSMVIYIPWAKKDETLNISYSKMAFSFFISVAIYTPNFLWNASNHFVSYVHTGANANLKGSYFHPDKALEFIGSQFGVFGLFFAVLLFLMFKIKDQIFIDSQSEMIEKSAPISRAKLLYSFSLPLVIIMTIEGFLSRANANWAAAAYVSASMLVTCYLLQNKKLVLIKSLVAIHMILAVFLYNADGIIKATNIELNKKTDIAKRLRGWDDFSKEVSKIAKENENATLLFDERKIITPVLYYMKPHPFENAAKFNVNGIIQDHYDLTLDVEKNFTDRNEFILVTRYPNADHIKRLFSNVEKIKSINIKIHDDYFIKANVFKLSGFAKYKK
jgi:4-amino-4-deoxy-L-arabinose transferase-like glycosyltransferase